MFYVKNRILFPVPKYGKIVRIEFNHSGLLFSLRKTILDDKKIANFHRVKKLTLLDNLILRVKGTSVYEFLSPLFSHSEIESFCDSMQLESSRCKIKDLFPFKREYIFLKRDSRKYDSYIYQTQGTTPYLYFMLYECMKDITDRGGRVIEITSPLVSDGSVGNLLQEVCPNLEDRVINFRIMHEFPQSYNSEDVTF